MNKSDLNSQLQSLIAIAFQAKSSQYLQEVLRIREDMFTNAYWHILVSACLDAMVEYQTDDLDKAFLIKFFDKKKLLAGPLMAFDEFMNIPVEALSIHRFKLEVDLYIEEMSKNLMRQSLLNVIKKMPDKSYSGLKADLFLNLNTIDINRDLGQLPEGCFNKDLDDILIDSESSQALTKDRVFTGIPKIDTATGGFKPGDLVFVLAYTGQGKSTLLQNFGYKTMLDGKNSVFFINELQYKQLKTKFIARHCANSMFWDGQAGGIQTKSIEMGLLTGKERKVMSEAIHDIRNSEKYGKIYIVQLPSDASISYIESKLTAIQANYHIDLVVIDDLRLCRGNMKGEDKTVLSRVIVDAKALAVNFNSGKGVPILSPWQTKQTSFTAAKETGKYEINSASDTNEVEKQADLMIWLLRTEELERKKQILAGVSKNRMGDTLEPFVLMEKLEYSYINQLDGVVVEGSKTVMDVKDKDFGVLVKDVLENF